jgi:hypothetical protein
MAAGSSEQSKGGFTHTMTFTCRSAKDFDCDFPIDSHMPCHEYAVLKATSQGHGRFAAEERHGMCELASAVQKRHVGDLRAFGTVGKWQSRDRGTAWYLCIGPNIPEQSKHRGWNLKSHWLLTFTQAHS